MLISFIIPVITVPLSTVSSILGDLLGIIGVVYVLLLIPLFFGLYLWAGIRAVKNYKLDVVGAGAVSAFSYFVVAAVHFILDILFSLVIAGWIAGVGTLQEESLLVGGIAGLVGVLGTILRTVVFVPLGIIVNFGVGALGGWVAKR